MAVYTCIQVSIATGFKCSGKVDMSGHTVYIDGTVV